MPPGEMVRSWGGGVETGFKGVAKLIQGEQSPLSRGGNQNIVINGSRYGSICHAVIGALEAVPKLGRYLTGGALIVNHIDGW
jgi:hypothetical protein